MYASRPETLIMLSIFRVCSSTVISTLSTSGSAIPNAPRSRSGLCQLGVGGGLQQRDRVGVLAGEHDRRIAENRPLQRELGIGEENLVGVCPAVRRCAPRSGAT